MNAETETEKIPEMTHYVLGLYRRTPGRATISEEEAARIEEGHLANLRHLEESGELIIAGPFEEDVELRGALIFKTGSVDHARELTATDPAIVNNRLTLIFFTWLAPAGLRVGPPPPAVVDDPDFGPDSARLLPF